LGRILHLRDASGHRFGEPRLRWGRRGDRCAHVAGATAAGPHGRHADREPV